MRTELPVCKRCCFCMPLRYGLITWGYIRLASSMVFLTKLVLTVNRILVKAPVKGRSPVNIIYTATLSFLILLTVTDLVVNTIFVVGGHKKNLKLLRVYYTYSFVLLILTALIAIDSAIAILYMFKIGEIDFKFHIWIIVVDIATLLAQSLVQICALLLVRSEIIKLRSHCAFIFVNNAAEAECNLKCEEINGEEGSEYTDERYVPELYK